MKLDLPIMIVSLLTVSALQSILPALPLGVNVKVPILVAIVVYYALDREWALSLVASVFAGILTDSLGGLQAGVTACFFLVCTLILLPFRKDIANKAYFAPLTIGFLVSVFLLFYHYICVLVSSEARGPSIFYVLFAMLVIGTLSAVVTMGVVSVMRKIELTAGTVEPRKEIGGAE